MHWILSVAFLAGWLLNASNGIPYSFPQQNYYQPQRYSPPVVIEEEFEDEGYDDQSQNYHQPQKYSPPVVIKDEIFEDEGYDDQSQNYGGIIKGSYSPEPELPFKGEAINFDYIEVDPENNDHLGVFGLGPNKRPFGPEYHGAGNNQRPLPGTPLKDIIRSENTGSIATDNERFVEGSIGYGGSEGPDKTFNFYDDKIFIENPSNGNKNEGSYGGHDETSVIHEVGNKNEGSYPGAHDESSLVREVGNSNQGSHGVQEETGNDSYFPSLSGVVNSLKTNLQSVYDSIRTKVPDVWRSFKTVLSKYSLTISQGAEYVGQRIAYTYDDIQASDLIKKLEKKLEEGNVLVDGFFQKVGEKIATWKSQADIHVDGGLIKQEQHHGQSFIDPTAPDLFKDEEIHNELQKLVSGGILRQSEMDTLSASKSTTHKKDSVYPAKNY